MKIPRNETCPFDSGNNNKKYCLDKWEDITPYVKIEDKSRINFNTLMLFRCTMLEYANKFLETGNLRFGRPQEWIEDCKKNGVGRGDLLEGAFAAIKEVDERPINFYKSIRPHVKMTENAVEGFYYFQSEAVLNMRVFCLFGLNDNMFPDQLIAEDKKSYPSGRIFKKYFMDFAPNITKENYESLKPNEKPVLLMIHNPHKFFERMRNFLYNLGLKDKEFIIHPVRYINKHNQFFVGDCIPGELFFKDSSFDYQSEIRIVICSRRKEIIDKVNATNGIFDIGSMKDIADIQDYYFTDFIMQKRGNSLLYVLPKPIRKDLRDCSLEELLGMLFQTYEDRLPEPPKNEKEKNEGLKILEDIIWEKYSAHVIDWKNRDVKVEDKNITLHCFFPE